MNKLAKMIAAGEINVEELADASDLIERAKLVKEGIEACKKTISFHLGETEVNVYNYMDSAGEYEAWGICTIDGVLTISCNWGGPHVTGSVNLNNFSDVFMAFEKSEFAYDLERFLEQQIKKSEEF